MNALQNLIVRRAEGQHNRGRAFSLLVVLALLLQIGLPGSTGMQVAQAAGPGGPSGSIIHTTAANFNTASCAVLTNTTVTSYNTDGEVRLLASLEDYFGGTEVDAALWNSGWINPDYPNIPTVAGGFVTLNGSYMQSTQLFNQSGRFMEARVLMRAAPENSTYLDVGFYRAIPPSPPSPGSAITADTAVRLFLVLDSGSNDLQTRLADGVTDYVDDDVTNPDMLQWHTFRINWGAVDTDFLVDGTSVNTRTEQLPGGDTLGARLLLYHLEPSPDFLTAPMQVDWIRGGQYPATGQFQSCVYDATGVVNFSNMSWVADVPTGSGLTIETRTSLDGTTWTGWTTPINAASGSSAPLTNLSGRYFQYRLNFSSANLIQSAELRDIQVNYFGPTTLDVTPASPTVNPGATQQFTATARDINNLAVTGVTVNWSVTGTGNGSINATGLYTAPLLPGSYSNVVNASVTRVPPGTLTDTASVTVPNTPPTAEAGGPYAGNEGAAIALTGTGSDPNGGAVTFAWDLNNDTVYETAGQNPNFPASDSGSYTVGLRVTDLFPSFTTDTATVNVANVAPTATFTAPSPVNEGSPVVLSLTSPSDPSVADTTTGFTYAFDCGSGFGAYSNASTANCPTNDEGSGTLAVGGRIRDKDNGVTTYTANVTVVNVPPTASSFNIAPGTVNEGADFTLTLAPPYFDPSTVDTTASFTFAFDCGSGTFSPESPTNNITCPTTDDGALSVRGRIMDFDGGSTIYTGSITVNSIAPQITSVTNNGPVLIVDPAQITVTATGFAGDVLTYEFDCNNDGIYEVGPQSSNIGSCTFSQSGMRTVQVRVNDNDGSSDTDSTVVEVTPSTIYFYLPLIVNTP